METIFLLLNHLFLLVTVQHQPTAAGVVYYVKPTEPCTHNSSCPFNETCHTMDHYASNSSHYFSPDHINVTLYFMCGVHNCTKHVEVHNLQVFSMIGTAESRQFVKIIMPIPTEIPNDPQNVGNRTYVFTNVSNLGIENAVVYFLSLTFRGKHHLFEAKQVDFHGYIGSVSPIVSTINITHSQAMLQDCTFQNNCFVRIHSYATLTVSDCIFTSYNHAVYSAIAVDNSTIRLSRNVTFLNNTVGNEKYHRVCGGAVSINSGYILWHKPHTSVLIITEAYVSFVNNTAMYCGGALYLNSTMMSVSSNVTMILTGNQVINNYYTNGGGGAMYIEHSHLRVENAGLHFIKNSAHSAAYGGAIIQIYGSMVISGYSRVSFVSNVAQYQGGAVHHLTYSTITVDKHSSVVFHNNSADQGGALYLQMQAGMIIVGSNSYLEFSYNTATKYGGAIYAYEQICVFNFTNKSSRVLFKNNSANGGIGMHIYGSSVKSCMNSFCSEDIVHYMPNISNSLSPVSSSPKRVCLCDDNGKPQCTKLSRIFVKWPKMYRGELFNISVVVVGYDFGLTTGTVSADFLPSKGHYTQSLGPHQHHQWIGNNQNCSNISYIIYSNNTHEALYLHASENAIPYYYSDRELLNDAIYYYNSYKHRCVYVQLLTTPVFINITLLDGCPPGFNLTFKGQLYGCYCYPILQNNQFDCFITNNSAYLKWNSSMWVNATFSKWNTSERDGIILAHYCPLNYCKSGEILMNLGTNPNAQCDFNHVGVLCGGCKNGYSLAIGSSHCIKCSNDLHLLMFSLFVVAGFLLVLFILLLNLTVTQGLINGLIFYANILWTYKDILFPPKQQNTLLAFQIFIAWLNLDFGIETCLVVGLTAFWKTWLQFLFPLYIWLIAGVIIIACRYSSRLTNIIGDRAVPLLATLFLLSYTKLLRTLMTIFEFGVLTHYPDESKIVAWYVDGNLPYCQHPHIYLFIVAVAVLIFLCLPFTLFLLFIQCWRRISHPWLQRWINKFIPFYDAYFAPLKDKHHYWFGTLLLIRGALLIVFTATSSTSPLVGLLIVAITLVMLLFYMSIKPVYKSKLVRLFENVSLSNLIVLISYTLYTGKIYCNSRITALQISIGVAFVQFFLIIIISSKSQYKRKGYNLISQESSDDDMVHERVNDPDISHVIIYPVRNVVESY